MCIFPIVFLSAHSFLGEGDGSLRTGPFDIPDDRPGGIVHEFDADLGDTASAACGGLGRGLALVHVDRAIGLMRSRGEELGL